MSLDHNCSSGHNWLQRRVVQKAGIIDDFPKYKIYMEWFEALNLDEYKI